MQLIFPVLLVIISILIISRAVIPIFSEYFQTNSFIAEELESFGFNSEMLSIIFCFFTTDVFNFKYFTYCYIT